jgi:peptidoglycan/xylan/chitin deacetylase (PgdA/CDA1 family)
MNPGQTARRLVAGTLHYSGVLGRYRRVVHRSRGVVLTYHRVLRARTPSAGVDPGMYVTCSTFERHLALLAQSYALVTIDQMGNWLAGDTTFDRPPCALTFDDGWTDTYEVAFPILQRYGVPATVFLITGAIGAPEMLNWPRIVEMERAGVSFGSHTVTHALLGRCDPARIQSELVESRRQLAERLVRPSRWFSFPKGSHSDEACRLASAYYAGAVTTEPGWVSKGDDPYRIRRINMHDDMTRTTALFAWKLALLR